MIEINLTEEIGKVTLNFPQKHNCIGMQMLQELEGAIKQLEKDSNCRVIVLEGAGEKSFSTGANLKEFDILDQEETKEWILFGNEVMNKIENCTKPVVAAIDGYTMGGGLEIALSCDFRIATETSLFSNPELKHGWIPGWGGMTRLTKIVGQGVAKEMLFLCQNKTAKELENSGLLHRVVTKEDFDSTVKEFTKALKEIDPFVFQLTKSAIQDPNRSTQKEDLFFDVLATYYSKFIKS